MGDNLELGPARFNHSSDEAARNRYLLMDGRNAPASLVCSMWMTPRNLSTTGCSPVNLFDNRRRVALGPEAEHTGPSRL